MLSIFTCTTLPYLCCFFFNDTATTEIYTLSLHDALPIYVVALDHIALDGGEGHVADQHGIGRQRYDGRADNSFNQGQERSEEHTSELQSRQYLVCRLLLATKKNRMSCI